MKKIAFNLFLCCILILPWIVVVSENMKIENLKVSQNHIQYIINYAKNYIIADSVIDTAERKYNADSEEQTFRYKNKIIDDSLLWRTLKDGWYIFIITLVIVFVFIKQ